MAAARVSLDGSAAALSLRASSGLSDQAASGSCSAAAATVASARRGVF
jgi:hypothetical protein